MAQHSLTNMPLKVWPRGQNKADGSTSSVASHICPPAPFLLPRFWFQTPSLSPAVTTFYHPKAPDSLTLVLPPPSFPKVMSLDMA